MTTVQLTDDHVDDATQRVRLDGVVDRSRAAADALRALDQEAVDRIVLAMVEAGLEHAIDLAELAMQETGFGVLEDKVVKNSIAIIDEDPERGLQYVAEPIGVVLALLPITNATSNPRMVDIAEPAELLGAAA